jgi:HK97 family phage major capsid protein
MTGGVSIHAKGAHFTRLAICLAKSGQGGLKGAHAIAEASYGPGSIPAEILKAAVAAGTLDSTAAIANLSLVSGEFVDALRPGTILGRLQGVRKVPTQVRIPRATSGSTVSWIGNMSPVPLSAMALDMIELPNLKLCGLVSSSIELIRLSSPSAEGLVRADLLSAVAAFTDLALIDPTAAATDISPASITYGAPSVAATGTTIAAAGEDLRALFRLVMDAGVDLKSPYLIMAPRTAIGLALSGDMAGGPAFPYLNLGPKGGEIAGVPVICSSSVPVTITGDSPSAYTSTIILVDASELIVGDDAAIELSLSEHSTLQMVSPADSPVTASTVAVSLWQHSLAAWKVTRDLNFIMRRPEAVGILTGVSY